MAPVRGALRLLFVLQGKFHEILVTRGDVAIVQEWLEAQGASVLILS
jgi:hypothetical protein